MKYLCLLISVLINTASVFAQANSDGKGIEKSKIDTAYISPIINKIATNFGLRGYGIANYFNFDWQTDPQRRNSIDLERFNLYPSYRFTDKISLSAEIEFEHGGTGTTYEFDRFEEFGEFETEVEKGGEITVEQLNIQIKLRPWVQLNVGKLKVPMGIITEYDEPTEYFTTTRNEAEFYVIPTNWYEHGIEFRGKILNKKLTWRALMINGLDGTGFSSANWIVRGNQKRFETVNAEDFAFAFRLDFAIANKSVIGIAAYNGNTKNNRPKPDLKVDAHVTVIDLHAIIQKGPFQFRGLMLYGQLQNADKLSLANRNLSNTLNAKRTPVGSAAFAYSVESAVDIMKFFTTKSIEKFLVFGRYEFYDTMYKVTGDVFDNGRWERKTTTFGVNYFIIPAVVFKAQYSMRTLGLAIDNKENTFSTGLGFEF